MRLFLLPCLLIFLKICNSFSSKNDFLFTLGTTSELRVQEDFSVFATLEESSNPVTFNLNFGGKYSKFLKSPTTQFTLNPGEARRLIIEVKDKETFLLDKDILTEESGLLLEVTAITQGLGNEKVFEGSTYLRVNDEYYRKPDKSEIVLQVDNDHEIYKPGMELNYRVLVMENRYQLHHSPLLIKSELVSGNALLGSEKTLWKNETAIEKGLLIGSATILPETQRLKVRVAQQGGSLLEEKSEELAKHVKRFGKHLDKDELKLKVESKKVLSLNEGITNVTISMFRSSRNIPVAGSCVLDINRNWCGKNKKAEKNRRNFTLDWETGRLQLELNIVKELDLDKENFPRENSEEACLSVTCKDYLTGQVISSVYNRINIHKNINTISLLSNEIVRDEDQVDDSNYALLSLKIEGRDGSDNNNLPGQLEVTLELSRKATSFLKHQNETKFSVDVPKSGIVSVRFPVKRGIQFSKKDKFVVKFGDAQKQFKFRNKKIQKQMPKYPSLQIVLAAPEKPLGIGENTKFVIMSNYKLDGKNISLNAVLHSAEKQYEMKRVPVNPDLWNGTGEGIIAEVEFVLPKVTTKGGLHLNVYGSCQPPPPPLPNKNKDAKKNKSICSGAIRLGTENIYGPIKLETLQTLENQTDLSTRLTFGVSGSLLDNAESILGTLQLVSKGYHVSQRNQFNLISNAANLFPPEFTPVTSVSKRTVGFVDFPVQTEVKNKNGSLSVIYKMFDWIIQAENYSLSAMVVMSSGEVSYTNEIMFTIPPAPIKISLEFLPYSVLLGESFEVEAVVENNNDVPYEGSISLEWFTVSNNGTFDTERDAKVADVQGQSKKSFLFKVTPKEVGEMKFTLKSDEFHRMVTKGEVLVLPYGSVKTLSKSFILKSGKNESEISKNYLIMTQNETIEALVDCKFHWSKVTREDFQLHRVLIDIDNSQPTPFKLASQFEELISWEEKGVFPTSGKLAFLRNTIQSRNTDGSFKDKCGNDTAMNYLSSSKLDRTIINTALKLKQVIQFQEKFKGNYVISSFEVLIDEFSQRDREKPKDGSHQIGDDFKNGQKEGETNATSETEEMKALGKYYTKGQAFNMSVFFTDVITSGVAFLETSIYSNSTNGTSKEDSLTLSILALLFSKLKLNDKAEKILNILEAQTVRDESGVYWTSKWNGVDTCQSQSSDLKPSMIATAFALSIYVKMRKDGAEEIANWLLSKYSQEEFKSFFEAEEVAKALDGFADYLESGNGERPLILTKSTEYLCPLENTTTDYHNFTLKTTLSEGGGKLLVLEVCRDNNTDTDVLLEITFPSGYAFTEFFHKPYSLKHEFVYQRPDNIYSSNRNSHLIHVPDKIFSSFGNCWNALAYRTSEVYFDKPKSDSDRRSFGRVAMYSASDYRKKTTKYFFI